jgi:alkaline phosphatase D
MQKKLQNDFQALFLRKKTMFAKTAIFVAMFFVLFFETSAQENLLQSGPMTGYSTMFEVMLWVQTKAPAKVHFEYFEEGKNAEKVKTDSYLTKKDEGFTARIRTEKLEPGRKYRYILFINDKEVKRQYPLTFQTPPLWHWRTKPPEFSFVMGSCLYINDEPYDRPGKNFGEKPVILEKIVEKKPDFMLWLGDNVYLREPDWESKKGIMYRYTHTRSIPEMQALLGAMHHYAIWDDHDFGPNDADRNFELKKESLDVFKLFWANPNYDVFGQPSTCGTFSWGDAQFFLLDNRSFRAPEDMHDEPERPCFGKEQLRWLKESLHSSKARFKFIVSGGQIINPAAIFSNYAVYGQERAELLNTVANTKGVVFLSGDRHHTVMQELKRLRKKSLFEITSSSLTAGVYEQKSEFNEQGINVPGTNYVGHNFVKISFSGDWENRKMTIECFDKNGAQIWTKEIAAKDLE